MTAAAANKATLAPESVTRLRAAARRKRTADGPRGVLVSVFSCAAVELDDIRSAFDTLIECLEGACGPDANRDETRARALRAAMPAVACFARLRDELEEGGRAARALPGGAP